MALSFKLFTDHIDAAYPFTFMDIGAMGGIPKKWDTLLDAMKVIAFEPDSREFVKLSNTDNVTYLNYALSNRSQKLKFYLTKDTGKSSVYQPNMDVLSQFENVERFNVIKEEELPSDRVKSLDAVMTEQNIEDLDFIKIDTQGSELPILMGGEDKAVPKIFGINIEAEFIEMYKKQPLFRDVDKFLYDKGFRLIDMRRYYWKRKDFYDYYGKGQLILGDALYLKDIDVLFNEFAAEGNKAYVVSKIYKCILTCMIYKMFDYAVSLLNRGLAEQYLSHEEYRSALEEIRMLSKKDTIPGFWGRHNFYRVLNFLCRKLRPASYLGWADSDVMIANIKDR